MLVFHDVVAVGLAGVFLLVSLHIGLGVGHHAIALLTGLLVEDNLLETRTGAEGRTVEERRIAILLTTEIGAEAEDVFWRVLVHRRVLRGTDDDDGV